jgi:hypothetical protein
MENLLAIERFAVRVATAVTGLPEQTFTAILRGDTDGVGNTQIDPAKLIEIILETILAVIEQCPQRAAYLARVSEPTRFQRVWFRRRFVRPINRDQNGISNEVLATAMVTEAGTTGGPELEQIYSDVTEPDFSVN